MKSRILILLIASASCAAGFGALAPGVSGQSLGGRGALRPNALSAQLYRAEIAYKSGASLLEAKVRVDRVLSKLPNDTQALKLRSKVLVAMGKYGDALVDARRAALLNPDDGEAQLLLAIGARHAGSHDLSVRSMERAAALLVDDAYTHVELSRLARELGEFETAEAYARIAAALEPNQSVCQIELARAFVAQGKLSPASLVLTKAVEAGIVERNSILADTLLTPLHKEFD